MADNNRRRPMQLNRGLNPLPQDLNEGSYAIARSLESTAEPAPGYTEKNMNGYDLQNLPIGREQISKAYLTLMEYKRGKQTLERNIIENEQWFKLRQWRYISRKSGTTKTATDADGSLYRKVREQVEPTSAWLFNCIMNKHADAMDNFPSPNILPREKGDQEEAKRLSSIIPVVMDQNNFEETYSNEVDNKLHGGTGVFGIFWDSNKLNGLGDIQISSVDILNLFWEPGITDIQDSKNLFYGTLEDNDILEQQYPQYRGKLKGNSGEALSKYVYDDTVDTRDKSLVVDWYYKKRNDDGRNVLHYAKFIVGQDEPLFATENEPGEPATEDMIDPETGELIPGNPGAYNYAENGLYDHGLYPFVFDPLYPCKGTPCGFSLIDVGKNEQEFIDLGDQAIMENMLTNARPRNFIRSDGAINEEEYLDATKPLVHVDGSLGEDSIRPIVNNTLSDVYVTVVLNKVEEMKEITGNRDVSTGGTTSGVTAASAIAAMQEAGSKLSRDLNKGSYRAYKKVVLMIIELIRQFYDEYRTFRIIGDDGAVEFVDYSNQGLKLQPQSNAVVSGKVEFAGVDVGYRLPEFDVKVVAEKASPYSKVAQNELAFQMYGAALFDPRNAEPAMMCLQMMDFDGKDQVVQSVSKNAMLYQNMMMAQQRALQLAQMLDNTQGSGLTQRLLEEFQMTGMSMERGPAPMAPQDIPEDTQATTSSGTGETKLTKQARERVAESTAPR